MHIKVRWFHNLVLVSAHFLLLVATNVAERLPVKIYTSADGLGSSFVNYIDSDSRGFMWFCTRDGLSRFDGSRFTTYQVGEKGASPGVENFYETRDGMYWITTTGGTFRFDPNMATADDETDRRLNAELITPARGQILEDSFGDLWLGSENLYKFDRSDGQFKAFELNLPPQPDRGFTVSDIRQALDGSLWLNTSWGIVRRLPDGRVVFYPHSVVASSGNSSLISDKSGRVWVTLHDQILVIKPESIETITESGRVITRSLVPNEIKEVEAEKSIEFPRTGGEIFQYKNKSFIDGINQKKLLQTSDGAIWITAETSLLELQDGTLHLHTDAEGLPNAMTHMGEDAAGNVWIGGQTGLARLDRQGMTTFGKNDGADSSRFFAITESSDGTLFFAGQDYFINRFDGQKFQSLLRPAVPKAPMVWTSRYAFLASNGDWWILSSDKLYRFSGITDFAQLANRRSTKTYSTERGFKSNGMFQIFEDSSGDIWVSTRGTYNATHGLSRLKKGDDEFYSFSENEGMPPNRSPSTFAEDSFGNLWVGFYEGGAARFDGERFTAFVDKGVLPDGLLADLHLDKKGRMWLGSVNGGLIRVDDTSARTPNFVYLTTADGLKSNNIRTITEDTLGRIYAGSASGVDRITPDSGRIKHYSVSDGLAADFVVDSHRDKSGNLWFATANGVSRLTPLPDEKSPAPRIMIGGLRIAGVRHPIPELGMSKIEKGELASTENNLQIDFFGLDLRAGESLRYQYKLEGADTDWSRPSELNTVNYANLRSANYRFLVRTVNSDGAFSAEPAVLSFQILSPIWARWWFITLAVLLLAAIVIAFYRYRTAKLRQINAALSEANRAEESLSRARAERIIELESVRTRIATDLHDDIGSSLTQIAILSEVAQEQGKKGNGAAAEPLTKITAVSNELVGTMSDIVWSINPSKDHLSDLSQRMRRFASDSLTALSIRLHFNGDSSDHNTVINSNLRREVFLIFKESINNIIKHAAAQNVWSELAVENGRLRLTIRDDGTGFDPDAAAANDNGNGLKSMRRRTLELGGAFDIRSGPDSSTTINVTFPIDSISATRPPERVG